MINNSAEDEKCCMTGYPVMQRFFARLQIATKVLNYSVSITLYSPLA